MAAAKQSSSVMDNLSAQLEEIEFLQSVYSEPGEFVIEDEEAHSLAVSYVNESQLKAPSTLSYSIHLIVDVIDGNDENDIRVTVDVSCRATNTYPSLEPPELSVRSDQISRRDQDQLNVDMTEYLQNELFSVCREVCVNSVIEWIKDNLINYCSPPVAAVTPTHQSLSGCHGDFCRMWLYMHHIYSKIKRRNILSLSKDYELSGFCLPGKPGVVCIEGTVHSTNEFYGLLRRWNWKSITCRKREVMQPSQDGINHYRRFVGFQELSFDIHGPRGNHLDLGQFKKYLEEHQLDCVFKDLFGV